MTNSSRSAGLARRDLLIGTAALAALSAAPAQAGWFDRIKNLFKSDDVGSLTEGKATDGLKEALRIGAERVVAQVGAAGGYLDDDNIHIPLPGWLDRAKTILDRAGASGLVTDLETRLNRAAEAAAPKAVPIFGNAIKAMTVQDAIGIIQGPENSATLYFEEKMTPDLTAAFRPVINTELEEAGAIQSFNTLTARFNQTPFVKNIGAGAVDQLVDHGLEGALGGLFFYLGKEEAKIRSNPAARTTEILKDVFGG